MKFNKKQVIRAIEELTDCLNNIINSARDQYSIRIRQLFTVVKNNNVLDYLFQPYLDLKLDEEKTGFINIGHSIKCDFIIPENEDEEISLILKVLYNMGEHEEQIDNATFSIFMKNSYDENLLLFNTNIIEPALKKLIRKIRYKLEDINDLQKEEVEGQDITIINIENIYAKNSQVAVGKNITQHEENIFYKIKKEIENKIENENDKKELLTYVTEMEKNIINKEIFRNYYDKFINRLGSYMTIFGPMLPFLVDYIK